MDETDVRTDEILDFLLELIRYRRRIMAALPTELARQRERLDKLYPADGPKRLADKDLFYRVGMILSRRNASLTMGELSRALEVPLSTATRIVDGLVDGGLAERVADPDDRRVVRVTLSHEGRDLYQAIGEHLRQCIDQLLGRFTLEERDQLMALLRKAMDGLNEASR